MTNNQALSYGITGFSAIVGGVHGYASATLAAIPQARLAKTAIFLASLMADGTLGSAASHVSGGYAANGAAGAIVGAIAGVAAPVLVSGALAAFSIPIILSPIGAAAVGAVASLVVADVVTSYLNDKGYNAANMSLTDASGALTHLGNEINNTINKIVEEAAQIAENTYESVPEFMGDLLDRLDSRVSEFSSDVEDYLSDAIDRVKDAVAQGASWVEDLARRVSGEAEGNDPASSGGTDEPNIPDEALPWSKPDGGQSAQSPSWHDASGSFYYPPISPLVFDLDGDGLDLIHLDQSTAYFDLNENGFAEHTAWISGDDGFLVHDVNGNGIIDDLSELFGGMEVDGFTTLSQKDDNGDGIIDQQDAVFADLKVWRDFNGDGLTNAGELSGLANNGIVNIDLNAAYVNYWDEGNWISHKGTFGKQLGDNGDIYDIWFENSQLNTVYLYGHPQSYANDVVILPNLAGYGSLPDLAQVFSTNEQFKADFAVFIRSSASMTATEIRDGLEAFILRWAGADIAGIGSRGQYIDARHLAFLETIHGQGFVSANGGNNPGRQASAALESYYNKIIDSMVGKIIVQIPISYFFLEDFSETPKSHPLLFLTTLRYDVGTDRISGDLIGVIQQLASFAQIASTSTSAEVAGFASIFTLVSMLAGEFGYTQSEFVNYMGDLLLIEGINEFWISMGRQAANKGHVISTTENDHIQLNADINETMVIAGLGDDLIDGGDGNDVYVYIPGDGHDTIIENARNGNLDQLFLYYSPSEITTIRSLSDLEDVILNFNDGGSILLDGQFKFQPEAGIEQLILADGTVWTNSYLRHLLLQSSVGADNLIGFSTNDTLDGGLGNDYLNGSDGSDTYIFNVGYGQDVIYDERTNILYDNDDKVLFGAGIDPEDIALSRNNDNLLLSISGTTDSLRIEKQFHANNLGSRWYEVESFVFSNGTIWTRSTIQSKLLQSTSGDDHLVGFFSNDVLDGGMGNDRLEGADGGDTYIFNAGYGSDVIYDKQKSIFADSPDKVVMGGGIAATATNIARSNRDLVLTFDGISDVLTIQDYFHSRYNEIEQFIFQDGTIWDVGDIYDQASGFYGTDGNDTLQGFDDDEVFVGGLGDDTLIGSYGSDLYIYNLGDGNDVIDDSGYLPQHNTDILRLTDIAHQSEIHLRRRNLTTNDLEIISPDGASIVVKNQFYSDSKGVERIEFSDGSYVGRSQFVQMALTGDQSDNHIVGFSTNDTLIGNGGNDILDGASGDDTLYGGDGDDILIGGLGADSFDGGAGSDTADFSYSDVDWIIDLAAGVAGTETLISIEHIIGSQGNDTIRGDSGDNSLNGYLGNDILTGNAGNDILNGGDGNDTLQGGDGDDILIGGFGTDSFDGGAGNDTADFSYSEVDWVINLSAGSAIGAGASAGENLAGIENIIGAAGNDVITGDNSDNVIKGGIGNDTIAGGAGNDTAVYVGALPDYVIRATSQNIRITDLNMADGDDGTDTLTGIEWLQFNGVSLSVSGVTGPIGMDAIVIMPENISATGRVDVKLPSGHTDGLTYQLHEGPSYGTLQLGAEGEYIYTPNPGFAGEDDFLVRVTDEAGFGDLAAVKIKVGQPSPYSPTLTVNNTARANETSDSDYWEQTPSVAALDNGNYVVAWSQYRAEQNNSDGVLARLYSPEGLPISGEFSVNTHTSQDQTLVDVAGLAGGGFIASWTSEGQDGSSEGVYGRIFNAQGTAVSNEIRINSTTSSTQRRSEVIGTNDGGFVVSWESWNQDGSSYGAYMRRFDAFGQAVTGEIRVNTTTAQWQFDAQVTELNDGRLLAVWSSDAHDSSNQAVVGRLFSNSGAPLTGEFRINNFQQGSQFKSSIAALANGGFVVVFEQWGAAFPSSSGAEISARIYNPDGSPMTGEFQVSTESPAGNQLSPAVTALDDGGFFVVWGSQGDNTVRGRQFTEAGQAEGQDIVLANYTISEDWAPQVMVLADSDIAVTWQASQSVAGNTNIFTRVVYGPQLTGGEGADVLIGDGEDNFLHGKAGNDIVTGGAGADIFIFKPGFGFDTVTDFMAGEGLNDIIQLDMSLADSFNDVLASASSVSGGTLIDFGTQGSIMLNGVTLSSLHQNDFQFV